MKDEAKSHATDAPGPPRCVACGGKVRRDGKSMWAIGPDLKIDGVLHRSHAKRWRNELGLTPEHTRPTTYSAGEAHRLAWAARHEKEVGEIPWATKQMFAEMTTDRSPRAKTKPARGLKGHRQEAKRLNQTYRAEFKRTRSIFRWATREERPRTRIR